MPPSNSDDAGSGLMDLQSLMNSMRIDGRVDSSRVEQVSSLLERQLQLDGVDPEVYKQMAMSFANVVVSKSAEGQTAADDPVNRSPSKQQQQQNGGPSLEQRTWSQESSSPEPETNPVQEAAPRTRCGAPLSPMPTKSPMGRGTAEARGRSRSPKPQQSNPAIPPISRNRSASPSLRRGLSPNALNQRSLSPLQRILRMGRATATPAGPAATPARSSTNNAPPESPASVYFDSKMDDGSTPQRGSSTQEFQSKNSSQPLPFQSPPMDPLCENIPMNGPTPIFTGTSSAFQPMSAATINSTSSDGSMGLEGTKKGLFCSFEGARTSLGGKSPLPGMPTAGSSPKVATPMVNSVGSINDDDSLASPGVFSPITPMDTSSQRRTSKGRSNPRRASSKNRNRSTPFPKTRPAGLFKLDDTPVQATPVNQGAGASGGTPTVATANAPQPDASHVPGPLFSPDARMDDRQTSATPVPTQATKPPQPQETGQFKKSRKTATPKNDADPPSVSFAPDVVDINLNLNLTTDKNDQKRRVRRSSRLKDKTSGTPVRPTADDRRKSCSPMDIDCGAMSPEIPATAPASIDPSEIQFELGVGDKPTSPTKGRRRRTKRQTPRGQTKAAVTNATPGFDNPPASMPDAKQSFQFAQPGKADVDYSGRRAMASAMRVEARDLYLERQYAKSILRFTDALQSLQSHETMDDFERDLAAVLLSNRAAGFLMTGAYSMAVEDAIQGTQFASSSFGNDVASSDSGPILRAKLYMRMAKGHSRMGELNLAEQAYESANHTASYANVELQKRSQTEDVVAARKILDQVSVDVTLGLSEVNRLKELINLAEQVSILPASFPERKSCLMALGHVNTALQTASGCDKLHEMKVAFLASLRRWREVASHCERHAASKAQLDSVFRGELSSKHPIPGIAPAKNLDPDFFGITKEDDIQGAEMKLVSKAVSEAVLRMPYAVLPYYIRALRLEERYPAAEAALGALESLVAAQLSLLPTFSWLRQEREKVTATKIGREKGDELFRTSNFNFAAKQYGECLLIDAIGLPSSRDNSSPGGRLHAVLHCNRAACLMALGNYREAVVECTAALRIHSRYMKAMLRRGRCYMKMERFDEAIAEFKQWIGMVEQARKRTPAAAVLTPCLFDGPHDATETDTAQVKQEMADAAKAKQRAEATSRADNMYRQQKERYQNDSFNNSSRQADAERRRDYFYSQKTSSRRWDSFSDRGPKKSSRPGAEDPKGRGPSPRANAGASSSGALNKSDDHYALLNIRRNASEAEIKKAFRKLALKYHPDKNSAPDSVENFRLISQAYEVLGDPAARRKYDDENRFSRRW